MYYSPVWRFNINNLDCILTSGYPASDHEFVDLWSNLELLCFIKLQYIHCDSIFQYCCVFAVHGYVVL